MFYRKKWLVLSGVLILTVAFLTGCIETHTYFKIDKNGMARIRFALIADQLLGGDESEIISYGLRNSILELQKDYVYSRKIITINNINYVYHIYETKAPVDINQHKYINFTRDNNHYRFELEIPRLVEKVDETDKDTLLFEISATLPGEIDMANSINTKGDTVTWSIYKKELVQGLTLKAITK